MNWERVFIRDDQLRPIWRFLLSAVMITLAYVGIAIVLGLVFGALGERPRLLVALFAVNLLLLPALLGIFRILMAAFEGKPLGSVGLAFRGRWRAELGLGLALGAAMVVVVAALQGLLGLSRFGLAAAAPSQLLTGGIFVFFLLLVGAVNEEMTFRGYAFQRLVESLGPVAAVLVTSLLFALAHLGNPFHTWISTLNTMLVGVPLAVAYLRTRALWLPIGIHFAWNFLQGYGMGFPVSGIVLPETILRAEGTRADWLTGGSYGPEGGLIASAVILAATLYLSFSKRIYMSDEMRELVFGPNPTSVNPLGTALSVSAHQADVGRPDLG